MEGGGGNKNLQNRTRALFVRPYRVHKLSNWTTTMNSEQYRGTRRMRVLIGRHLRSASAVFCLRSRVCGGGRGGCGEGWPMDLSQRRRSFKIGIRLFFSFFLIPSSRTRQTRKTSSSLPRCTSIYCILYYLILFCAHSHEKIYRPIRDFVRTSLNLYNSRCASLLSICVYYKSEFKTILACVCVRGHLPEATDVMCVVFSVYRPARTTNFTVCIMCAYNTCPAWV